MAKNIAAIRCDNNVSPCNKNALIFLYIYTHFYISVSSSIFQNWHKNIRNSLECVIESTANRSKFFYQYLSFRSSITLVLGYDEKLNSLVYILMLSTNINDRQTRHKGVVFMAWPIPFTKCYDKFTHNFLTFKMNLFFL